MTTDTTTVTVLLGIITSLLGVVSYVYRDSLKRADAHMAAMEDRYDELLRNAVATLTQVATSQTSMFEIVKKMQDGINDQQIEVQVAKRLHAAGHAAKADAP